MAIRYSTPFAFSSFCKLQKVKSFWDEIKSHFYLESTKQNNLSWNACSLESKMQIWINLLCTPVLEIAVAHFWWSRLDHSSFRSIWIREPLSLELWWKDQVFNRNHFSRSILNMWMVGIEAHSFLDRHWGLNSLQEFGVLGNNHPDSNTSDCSWLFTGEYFKFDNLINSLNTVLSNFLGDLKLLTAHFYVLLWRPAHELLWNDLLELLLASRDVFLGGASH